MPKFEEFIKNFPKNEEKSEWQRRLDLINKLHAIQNEYFDGIEDWDRPSVEKEYGSTSDDEWGYILQEVNRYRKGK